MNASTLSSALLTKFAASFICIDPMAKHKTNFKYSDQIYELNLHSLSKCNILLTIMTGDFNAKSKQLRN